MRFSLFLKEAALFASIQGLALFIAPRINLPAGQTPAAVSAADILLMFGVATLLMLAFTRLVPSRSAFAVRALWLVALLGGIQILFGTFLPRDIAFIFALFLVIVYAKAATVGFHNFMLVIGLPGIGALLGAGLLPFTAAAVLLVLSLYDIIAVYWTGHMVAMAQRFMEGGVVPGVVVRTAPPHAASPFWITDVRAGGEAVILGTGDLVLPSILAVSAWRFLEPVSGFLTATGAMLGLFVTHQLFFGQQERRPMPALPPIAVGAIAGFLLSLSIV
jgi:presenilin-like A22 family membrane protease